MDDREAVRQLEEEWIEALRQADVAALERIWDDDFVFTDPNGQALSKVRCLREMAAGALHFNAIAVRSMQIRVFDDTAVVVGIIWLEGRAGESDYRGEYSFFDVYLRRAGGWRAVLSSGDRVVPLRMLGPDGQS